MLSSIPATVTVTSGATYPFHLPNPPPRVTKLLAQFVLGYLASKMIDGIGRLDHYEHMFLEHSMQRMEHLLAEGDTSAVAVAISVYNKALAETTNNYYRASFDLWEALQAARTGRNSNHQESLQDVADREATERK